MKKCLNCNADIDNYKKFCNKSCAAKYNNSRRKLSEETKEKISRSLSGKNTTETDKRKSGRIEAGKKRTITAHKKMMESDFNTLGLGLKKKRVKIEQNNICLHCNLSEWMGLPLTLEVDHIDGDNTNNNRNNLRALCPNCHSQTDTWRSKNITNRTGKIIPDDELIKLIKESKSIAQVIKKTTLPMSTSSYKRIKKIMNIYKISLISK